MAHPPEIERTKATRLRSKLRAGAPLSETEANWLNDYEEARTQKRESRGASATRKVSYTEEESAAVGTGTAAETAAAAAMVREEGRRLDSLTTIAINAMAKACELHEKMAQQLLAERMADAKVQRALLEAVRGHFLARVDAEAALREQEGDEKKEGLDKMIEELVPHLLPAIMEHFGGASPPPGKKAS